MSALEEWRPIPGYEFYQVSDAGRVWSQRRKRTPGGILKPWIDSLGYPTYKIRNVDGQERARRVHLLVAAAFLGPKPDGLVTRHLDGDPLNNTVENLAYGTHAENAADTLRHGRHNHAKKTHCKRGHEFTVENTWMRHDGGRSCRACGVLREASRPRRGVAA